MSAKKKSQRDRNKRQQNKQQRRKQRVEKRQAAATRVKDNNSDHIIELTRLLDIMNPNGDLNLERMAEVLAELEEAGPALIDEPEFDDVGMDPMDALTLYIEIAEEKGVTPELLANMEGEARQSIIAETSETLLETYLEEGLQARMLAALVKLRHRLQAEGNSLLLRQAAAAELWLRLPQESESREMMPSLCLDLVLRDVHAGFELGRLEQKISDEVAGMPLSPQAVHTIVEQEDSLAPLSRILDENPYLRRFLNKQIDDVEAGGERAIISGDLQLDLYTEAERAAGVACFPKAMQDALASDRFDTFSRFSDQMPAVIESLYKIVDGLSPERIVEIGEQIDAALKDALETKSGFGPYLLMFQSELTEDRDVAARKLMITLMAESLQTAIGFDELPDDMPSTASI